MTTLRVLELGACDAGIDLWLQRELNGDLELLVDGMELDRRMIRDARQRTKEAGLPGRFVQANALDAPLHFEPRSYDAVVAFELVEHVPDPVELMRVCEEMVRPGGKVFLSTPDGTFGEGRNPHHLRAWTASQLHDQIRRRGRVDNMLVGSDGVSVAAYIPGARREDVAIFTGPAWEPWSPMDIESKGLGGSETAAVRLADALSAEGWVVTVYGDVEQCAYRDVLYRHHSTFDPTEPRGAVIASRMPEIFDRPVKARANMLWVHDVDVQDRLTDRRARRIDTILCLSDWHHNHLAGRYPDQRGKLLQIRNGIQPEYFHPKPWEDRAPRVLYTSSPDRGVDVLLELWPRVREQVPDAEFRFCYPSVYDRVANLDERIGQFRARVADLADQPGVEALGSLPQQDLAALMCDSRVWAHPSWITDWNRPFEETSCMGAMEAQAAGCLVVASGWGALPQTVKWGRLVNSGPPGKRWKDSLVKHIVEGLTDPKVGEKAVSKAQAAQEAFPWAPVARQLTERIELAGRPHATSKPLDKRALTAIH